MALTLTAQNCYDYKHPCNPGDTLIDKKTCIKFTTDTSGKGIIALDANNNLLWHTNPWNNEHFRSYDSSMNELFRANRISSFFFTKATKKKDSDVIVIMLKNSPVAVVIEKENGKLHVLGVM